MAYLTLDLLGPLRISLAGVSVTVFEADKARALLLYLAVESDHPHRRDELTGLLWPESPEQAARHNLRQTLFNLRRAIRDDSADPSFLLVTREEIQFNAASDHALDVAEFNALLAACDAHRHEGLEACAECASRIGQAAALYRGKFLEQFFLPDSASFEEWALLQREALHQRALDALTHLANYHAQRADHESARRWAARQLELDPWREEAHRQMMRALAASGQRSAALVQYETCRRVLADELGVEPSAETRALYENIRNGNWTPAGQAAGIASPALRASDVQSQPAALPAPQTPFIGRERELADLQRLMPDAQCRLITLVGPGGIGKTRLALETAANQRHAFMHGAVFVSLASVTSPSLIVDEINQALGLSFPTSTDPMAQLVSYLTGKQMLLILDNFDHLLEGAPLIAEILSRAPGIKLIVTSRAQLNLQGEWVFQVGGLSVPQSEEDASFIESGAVALFLQRARRARLGFELHPEDRAAVTRLCRLLEGMPLGLELAATWVRVLSCNEIVKEIEHSLDFLASSMRDLPERHRSMRAVFDHSWDMLTGEERQVMRRLSVFRGGFSRQAAEAVSGTSLSILASLVWKSLVRRAERDRYDVHEIVRQYARERLVEAGELESVSARHLRFYLEFAETAEEKLRGAEQLDWLEHLEKDHSNICAALEWSLSRTQPEEQAAQDSLRLAGALFLFWRRRGHWSAGRDWLKRALAQSAGYACTPERVKALNAAVLLAVEQADTRAARPLSDENVSCALALGDSERIAGALDARGYMLWKQKDFAAARSSSEQALSRFRQLGDEFSAAESLHHLGHAAINQDDLAGARAYLEEGATLYRRIGDTLGLAAVLGDLGLVAYLRKDYAAARTYQEESLARSRVAQCLPLIEAALNRLGDLARCQDDYDKAATLYTESLALYRDMGDRDEIPSLLHNLGCVAHHRRDYAQALALFREALAIQQENSNAGGIAECLVGIAGVYVAQGKAQRGARLLGAAEAQREGIGATLWPANQIEYDRQLALLRRSLDDTTFDTAWAEGRGMAVESAIAAAMVDDHKEPTFERGASGVRLAGDEPA